MADRDVPEGGEAIDVLPAVSAVDIDALAALEHHRLLVEVGVEERVHPVIEVILDECAVLGVVHWWAPNGWARL